MSAHPLPPSLALAPPPSKWHLAVSLSVIGRLARLLCSFLPSFFLSTTDLGPFSRPNQSKEGLAPLLPSFLPSSFIIEIRPSFHPSFLVLQGSSGQLAGWHLSHRAADLLLSRLTIVNHSDRLAAASGWNRPSRTGRYRATPAHRQVSKVDCNWRSHGDWFRAVFSLS